ncbi:LacI family DNA-binding transcriptional regulator [Limoniibacter endophyticus]|uniref:LacI family transcriptional regulator n=1 Tax=Limoniibacter endophyticus TaxID=1565040 RepID=A0A8J3DPV9_9HYPH|nr:LacI family DNA-binding transcriptional regulator [Limoniibacter endophyticus]GHC70365.1 LacI family transcriptional regulator [Limoniibacter endophyticus]
MTRHSAPNIREVAAMAGVSTATVSRTLAEPNKVRETTREKVMKAVEALNFVPNAQARSFRQRSNRTVILLVRDIANPFYLEIYRAVEEEASAAGYKVLMGDARGDATRVANHIDMVRERHADGLILMIGRYPEELVELKNLPPIVMASETFEGLDLPSVKVNNVAAAKGAVAHLIAQGHHAIVHLAGPLPEQLASDRLAGYRTALAEAGISFDPSLVEAGDYSIEAGRQGIEALFARGKTFSAVFASSDQMAIGAIAALRSRGLSVPQDISVIGFDDILFANAFEPPLSTVRQPRRELGRHAMRMMIELLSGNTRPADVLLPTELILRGSVASASARKAGSIAGKRDA